MRRSDVTAEMVRLMNPEDQERFALNQRLGASSDDFRRGPKTDASERKAQGSFANWLLLQRSKGRKLPFVWHATHTRSKATPGTPDFLVGTWGGWICIEFKRDYTNKLSGDQQEFQIDCDSRGLPFYIAYNEDEAIKFVEKHDQLR
jgi:hypothetical protein